MGRAFTNVARRMAGINLHANILGLYVARRILAPFILFLAVLLMALSLERLLRLVQIVTEQKASFFKAFEMLFYLLPHYLGLAVPAALFFAVLVTLRRMHEDSELVVIQGAGINLRRLYSPVMALALAGTVCLLFLSGIAQPHARYEYRATLHGLAADNPLAGVRAGTFAAIGDNVTLRADKIDASQGLLEGVFISRLKPEQAERITIAARTGVLTQEGENSAPVLQLENGNLVREDLNGKKISRLSFSSFPWQILGALGEPYGRRGQNEREMTWRELRRGGVSGVVPESTPAQHKTEFHKRIVQALSLPFLVLWALPLALVGSGRGGRAVGLVPGALLLVLYEKTLGLGESYAAQGAVGALPALWGPWLLLGLGGLVLARYVMPEKTGKARS